jgi:hypothetical protein
MANINKNEIGYNENTTANALMVQYKRGLAAPMDISEVFTSLEAAQIYASTDPIAYAGQKVSVAGENIKTEVYKITSGGTLVRLIDENDLAAFELPDNLATTEDVANASAATFDSAKTYVDGKLVDYATKSYVTNQIVSAMTGGEIELTGYAKEEDVKKYDEAVLTSAKTYTDTMVSALENELYWLPVEGEKHKIRKWRGSRENYEFLVKNNAVDSWTKYVVIDKINNVEIITEYYGANQVAEHTGQLLPVLSVIGSISEITPAPYDRYLVGADGNGYNVYEYVIDSDGEHRWIIKPFDYRHGVRVLSEGLKNYIYIDGKLRTYDDVDCGVF